MIMVLSDAEKQAVWNDRARLQETIMRVAGYKNEAERLLRKLTDELTEAKIAVKNLEPRLKIVEEDCAQIDTLGRELTIRIMELEQADTLKKNV